jgi:hypothetical protein
MKENYIGEDKMPLVARGTGSGDTVECVLHGKGVPNGCGCCATLVTTTDECSGDVFVEGVGAVRATGANGAMGDKMTAHMRNYGPPGTVCNSHTPPCNAGSPNVFVNSQPVARLNDTYFEVNNHIINSVAQSTVFANGG